MLAHHQPVLASCTTWAWIGIAVCKSWLFRNRPAFLSSGWVDLVNLFLNHLSCPCYWSTDRAMDYTIGVHDTGRSLYSWHGLVSLYHPLHGHLCDLMLRQPKHLRDPKPSLREQLVHVVVFGIVEVGKDTGAFLGFAKVIHQLRVGFATGDLATDGFVFHNGSLL